MNWTPDTQQAEAIDAQRAATGPVWSDAWLTADDQRAWR